MTDPAFLHLSRGGGDVEAHHHRIRNDITFAAEMTFCHQHGIPHSIFLGRLWPDPRSPLDPYWQGDDRRKAVLHTRWKAEVCPQCGLHPLDWEHERDETHKGVMRTCWGCVELADTAAQIPDEVPDDRRRAIHIQLQPRPPGELLLLEAGMAGR